ncbi:MAG: 4-hydroxyphenylpyruvate dioxygenase [Candidatus Marinimicrobia bacterium]|nr:4-hydroxyphenylpyruvate dioxygenase [Candidatus Neomarinimicrobiota bacterium]|tara:strand:- start:7495 stop:8616 length:1122 start_codon:yes stop_codon:yes gene_type:complete
MSYITDQWTGTEYFKINDFDHLEFYVGNAKQVAHFYRSAFGFQPFAYCGPETGMKDHVSYVLKQNNIFFVFTTPLNSWHPASEWLSKHGDGVRDVAMNVNCDKEAHDSCLSRGAISFNSLKSKTDSTSGFGKSSIKAYGDTIHSFVSRPKNKDSWAPGFKSLNLPNLTFKDPNLIKIDHIVANVEVSKMDYWKDYYESIFGFSAFVKFDETDISTEYSSLKSVVVRSKNWKIKLPINEPAEGLKKSQIEEYLDSNQGPGVQHIALLTGDIVSSIQALRENGVDFLDVPDTYYDNLRDRIGDVDEDIEKLRSLKILVDRDEEGYLLQLFTKPLQDRPTLFIEIIQRKGSRGFGQGNFQALFEAIEREQEKRGNL